MEKKFYIIFISLLLVIILIEIAVLNFVRTQKQNQKEEIKTSQIEQELVTDGCIDELEDYQKFVNEKIEEASNMMIEDDTHYILRKINGYIEVFYIAEDNKE